MRYGMLILALGALLALGACKTTATGGGKTLSEFRGFCLTGSHAKRGNCDTNEPCNAFSAMLDIGFPSLDACLSSCEAEYKRQSFGNFNCASVLNKARTLCTQYCRGNYPQ